MDNKSNPPPPHDTIPAPPPEAEPEPIPAGKARLATTLAFAAVVKALEHAENAVLAFHATADGIARALDETATPGRSTP